MRECRRPRRDGEGEGRNCLARVLAVWDRKRQRLLGLVSGEEHGLFSELQWLLHFRWREREERTSVNCINKVPPGKKRSGHRHVATTRRQWAAGSEIVGKNENPQITTGRAVLTPMRFHHHQRAVWLRAVG